MHNFLKKIVGVVLVVLTFMMTIQAEKCQTETITLGAKVKIIYS